MKKTVLLDVDGVLAQYSGWKGIENIGDPIPGAVEFTKKLGEFARVVIYTTRCTEYITKDGKDLPQEPDRRPASGLRSIVQAWLDKHGFYYDEIFTGQGKPFAAAIIDDRAVSCRPQENCVYADGLTEFDIALDEVKSLCDGLNWNDISTTLKSHEESKQ